MNTTNTKNSSEKKKGTNKGIVYIATNLINGKKYVGITTREFSKRVNEHKYDSFHRKGKKNHFHNAINKYGFENFSFQIIEEINEDDFDKLREKLYHLESYYIKYYSSFDKTIGYNLTLGGEGVTGFIMSDEQRKKISAIHKGKKLSERHKQIISDFMRSDKNPRKGKPLSEETKLKLSKAHMGLLVGDKNPMFGKKRPDLTERNLKSGYKVFQIDITSHEVIKIWNSLREISRETGWNRSCISDCCNGKTSSSHGYIWRYVNK